jgi:hypothetical protein
VLQVPFAATYSNVGSSITDYYLSHNIIILNSQSIGSTYGIFNTNGIETRNINNNSISITGSGSTVLGMNITGGTTTNIYGNTISDIVSNGIATGILIFTSGTNFNLYNNKIYEITSNGSSGLVSGIRLLYGTNVYIYNNFISHLNAPVRSNSDAIRGINIESTLASSTIGLYYNTIYLNASINWLQISEQRGFTIHIVIQLLLLHLICATILLLTSRHQKAQVEL